MTLFVMPMIHLDNIITYKTHTIFTSFTDKSSMLGDSDFIFLELLHPTANPRSVRLPESRYN